MSKQKKVDSLLKPVRLSISFYPKSIMHGILVSFGGLYLLFTVSSSQSFDPCMHEMEYYRKPTALTVCLKKIDGTKYFNSLFERYRTYVPFLNEEINQENQKTQNLISYYETFLVYNPKARDILLTLAKLYAYQNNTVRSEYYFSQAKLIDPRIKQ
jgi:hypothetical protein